MTGEVRIERVENGFVIIERSDGRMLSGRTWVAVSVVDLAKLVTEVFEEQPASETKPLHKEPGHDLGPAAPGYDAGEPMSKTAILEGKKPGAESGKY